MKIKIHPILSHFNGIRIIPLLFLFVNRRRLFKYVVPVVLISIIINIPKFFESRVRGEYINGTTYINEVSPIQQTTNNESMSTIISDHER